MLRNKLTLSIVAFVASIVMFIGATFAWFIIQEWVDVFPITKTVVNVDATAGLEISPDGIEYDTVTSISTQNRVPGDTVYYRLQVDNNGEGPIVVRIRLKGFMNSVNNPLKSDANFQAGRSLIDAIYISASNDVNSDTVDNMLMSDLIGPLPIGVTYDTAELILFNGIPLSVGASVAIVFSFTIGENIGNNYQNLELTVDSILIDAIQE